MRQSIDQRNIGARQQRQVIIRLDMRRFNEINAARVSDNQLGPRAQALFHARGKNGMAVGRIRANHENNIRLFNRFEILRARRGAESLVQAITGG